MLPTIEHPLPFAPHCLSKHDRINWLDVIRPIARRVRPSVLFLHICCTAVLLDGRITRVTASALFVLPIATNWSRGSLERGGGREYTCKQSFIKNYPDCVTLDSTIHPDSLIEIFCCSEYFEKRVMNLGLIGLSLLHFNRINYFITGIKWFYTYNNI